MSLHSGRYISFSVFNVILFLALVGANVASAYGPVGHEIIGAIADEKLAHTPTGEKIAALLDGMKLENAATIPDEIRGWDKNGPDDPMAVHHRDHPKIEAQVLDYWRAN